MKKRILSILLVTTLIVSFGLFGCNKKEDNQPEPVKEEEEAKVEENEEETPAEPSAYKLFIGSGYDSEYFESGISAMVSYPTFKTGDAGYEGLQQALDSLSEKLKDEADEAMTELCEFAKEDTLYEGETYRQYFYNLTAHMVRADESITSIIIKLDTFSGGAHGGTYYTSYNFDSKTGEEITSDKTFKEIPGLLDLIKAELEEHYTDAYFYDLDSSITDRKNEGSIPFFSLGNEGVTFIFNEYDIAPYSEGTFSVFFPYNEIGDYLTGDFNGNSNYIEEILVGMPETLRMGSDGGYKNISIYSEWGDFDAITGLKTYGDLEWNIPLESGYTYDLSIYHFICESGNYLLVETMVENDYRELTILSIDGDEAILMASNFSGFSPKEISDGIYLREVPTNIYSISTARYSDVLGTSLVFMDYNIAGGDFMALNDAYRCDSNHKVTLSQDQTFKSLDEAGNESEEVTVPAGTVLTLLETDGESYADCQYGDTIVRIYVDMTDYPHKVNDIPIEDVFSDIMFAG